jgi:hypothetical protein
MAVSFEQGRDLLDQAALLDLIGDSVTTIW